MMPAIIFGIFNVGYQQDNDGTFLDKFYNGLVIVLPIIAVSYTVGGICEVLFAIIRKHEVNEGFLVTGMLIAVTMPPAIPLWMVAIATVFGVIIGKEIFGGTGYNIFNPALTARVFLFFAYPIYMSGNKPWIAPMDGMSKATPLLAKSSEADFTYSWSDMFFGFIPGSIGETSTLAVLLGAGLLLLTGVGSWRTMLSTCIGMVVTSLLLNQLSFLQKTSLTF